MEDPGSRVLSRLQVRSSTAVGPRSSGSHVVVRVDTGRGGVEWSGAGRGGVVRDEGLGTGRPGPPPSVYRSFVWYGRTPSFRFPWILCPSREWKGRTGSKALNSPSHWVAGEGPGT